MTILTHIDLVKVKKKNEEISMKITGMHSPDLIRNGLKQELCVLIESVK